MLRYVYAADLDNYPLLKSTMFQDRAEQFSNRLGWDVQVDHAGAERDEYDDLNPLYVIWENEHGRHGGSMRFLPTVGRTMMAEHFADLTDGVTISSPLIWESTRFCLARGAAVQTSAALMLAGCEIGQQFHLSHAAGVFDDLMVRIYRRLGWPPTIVGTKGTGRDAISAGLWDFGDPVRQMLLAKSGISNELSRHWFDRSFGGAHENLKAVG